MTFVKGKSGRVSLSELHLWDKNPRTIKDKRFKELCKSLKDDPSFMELRPILATKEGRIYAGNMRYRAAKELGWTEVPAILTDIDEKLANERAIKDNNQFGEWNNDELATLLDEMEKAGSDIESLGLDDAIAKIVTQLNEADIVEDEVPEPPAKPKSKPGDLYQLGNHRLLCGDSTKLEDVERLMNGQKADMVFTDPPYGVNYEGGVQFDGKGGAKTNNREKLKNDDTTAIYTNFLPVALAFVDGPCYMWFADSKVRDVYNAVFDNDCEVHALIIWHKTNATYAAMNAQYKQRHEPCLYFKPKGSTLRWCGSSAEATVWNQDRDGINDMHPTQKPVALAAKAIGNHEAESVLDCFGGSGSTLIACEQLKRKCYMMELDPRYIDVIVNRWEKLTGKKAVLL